MGIKGEGKVMDGGTNMLNNLGDIESGGGSSSSLGGADVRKGKCCHFPLQCVISCDNGILKHLLLDSGKGV